MENTVETLAALLGATLQRLPDAAAPEQSAVSHLATAVHRVHAANTANYTRWMGRLGLKQRVPPTSASAQLHQLVLWYLIWGEAANLRLLPECLCLVLYCASNALQLPATVGWPVATLVDEAAAAADNAVHEATKHSTDAKLSHQSSSFQSASRLSGFPEGDFLASIVTPVYGFLKREVSGLDAEAQAQP